MKVKYSVIPFIPATIVMLFLKVMSIFGADDNGLFMGMNSMNITYTVIGIAIGLFVICVIINLFDRKTAPVYPVKKNLAAGVFAIMSGLSVMASALSRLIVLWPERLNSEFFMMTMVCAIFAVPAGIALLLISQVHFQGRSIVSSISILFVFPALWGCTELVNEFLQATKASIQARDLTGLFCYIFITLFLFSNSMVVSRIKGRNPVKGVFIYGLTAAALSITFGVYEFYRLSREGYEYSAVLYALMLVVVSAYTLSFVVELYVNVYTKDELDIVDGLPVYDSDDDDDNYVDTLDYDDLVFSERPSEDNLNVEPADDYYSSASGLDEFIFGYNFNPDDDDSNVKKNEFFKKTNVNSPRKTSIDTAAVSSETALKEQLPYKKDKKNRRAEKAEKRAEKDRLAAELLNAEEERKAAEAAQRSEEAKMAMEAAKKAENERRAEEASKQQSEEAKKAIEAAKQAEAARKSSEFARKKEEQQRVAEAARKAEEQKNAKLSEEAQRKAEAKRLTEEQRKIAEAKKAEEAARQAEAKRLAEEQIKIAEAKKAEEAARQAEAIRRAEEARKEAEAKQAEAARKHAELIKKAEQQRKIAEAKEAERIKKQAEAANKVEEPVKTVVDKAPQTQTVSTPKCDEKKERYKSTFTDVERLLKELEDKK